MFVVKFAAYKHGDAGDEAFKCIYIYIIYIYICVFAFLIIFNTNDRTLVKCTKYQLKHLLDTRRSTEPRT